MSELLTLLARIIRQGPVAPRAGDSLSLSVYEYEAAEAAGPIAARDRIDVAHRESDASDPGFAVGRTRFLKLTRTQPAGSTLLYWNDQPPRPERLWFCPESRSAT
jgi:hypothetical protein